MYVKPAQPELQKEIAKETRVTANPTSLAVGSHFAINPAASKSQTHLPLNSHKSYLLAVGKISHDEIWKAHRLAFVACCIRSRRAAGSPSRLGAGYCCRCTVFAVVSRKPVPRRRWDESLGCFCISHPNHTAQAVCGVCVVSLQGMQRDAKCKGRAVHMAYLLECRGGLDRNRSQQQWSDNCIRQLSTYQWNHLVFCLCYAVRMCRMQNRTDRVRMQNAKRQSLPFCWCFCK